MSFNLRVIFSFSRYVAGLPGGMVTLLQHVSYPHYLAQLLFLFNQYK